MPGRLLILGFAGVVLAALTACGGRGGGSGGGGGGYTPPVDKPPYYSGGYNSGYQDGYQQGLSDRFHDDPWYFDPWRSNRYYDSQFYDDNYSSSRRLSSHPLNCSCGCRDSVNVYQTRTYQESAGGIGSPALRRSGNLPLSGAGSDGVLDSLEIELLQMQRPVGVSELLWADLKQAAKEAARSVAAVSAGDRETGVGGRVLDLTVEPGFGPNTIRFQWSYRNDGDYDIDGRVRAADMAQVGIWYGRRSSDPDWNRARCADGNGDGLISIADASVIGINYGCRVDYYILASELGDFDSNGEVNMTDITPIGQHFGISEMYLLTPRPLFGQSASQIIGRSGAPLPGLDIFIPARLAGGEFAQEPDGALVYSMQLAWMNELDPRGLNFVVVSNMAGNDRLDEQGSPVFEATGLPSNPAQFLP